MTFQRSVNTVIQSYNTVTIVKLCKHICLGVWCLQHQDKNRIVKRVLFMSQVQKEEENGSCLLLLLSDDCLAEQSQQN